MGDAMIPMKQLQDITECPICQESFSDPRSLPCIHTFCLKCISAWADGKSPKDSVNCPMCRKEFSIPDKGIADLPKNIFIGKLLTVDALSCGLGGTYCDWCQTGTLAAATDKLADVRCIECQQNLCEVCKTAHTKIEAIRNHQFVTLGQKFDATFTKCMPSKCDEHPDKDLEIYCFDCEETLCIMCFLTQHHGHKSGDVKKVASDCRTKMNSCLSTLVTGVRMLTDSSSKLQKCRQEVLNKFTRVELEVNAQADQLIATIERYRRELLCECKQLKDKRLKEVDHDFHEVTQKKAMTESLMKYCDELLKKGSNSDLTRETKSLQSRVAEIKRLFSGEPVTITDYVVTFTSADTPSLESKNCIGNITDTSNSVTQTISTSLAHVIPGIGDCITAVTSFNSLLFVAYEKSDHNQIAVYNTCSFLLQRHIKIPGALGQHFGLATCATNNCLYVSSHDCDTVHRVNLSTYMETTVWSVARYPVGLSVNNSHNVLVACDSGKIQEYTPTGTAVRDFDVQKRNGVMHVVEHTDGILAVSLSGPWHGVFLMAHSGSILYNYGSWTPGKGNKQMNYPRTLAVSKRGFIAVADLVNQRILLLNPSLSEARPLLLPVKANEQISRPIALWLDEVRGRLYVGENGGCSRLLVFNNIFNLDAAFAPS